MPNITLRGIPDDIHTELKAAAKRNHRSLNGEILARLTRSVRPLPADRAELLQRIEREREARGPIGLDNETIKALKNAGRP
ncbi:MAG: Arc family DNA-binding protein [Chloroflexi bacterium]|nr:Arc family DNA-binding protein [Chloroflexota bacterium]